MRRGIVLTAVLLSTACSSVLSPAEVLALRDAEARWAARPFQSYTYETIVSCFCPPVMSQWARVAVTGNLVTGAVLVANDSAVAADELASFPTIDELFASIRGYQESDWAKDVIVTYDRQYGHPTEISVYPKPGILDAGSTRYTRNLVPQR